MGSKAIKLPYAAGENLVTWNVPGCDTSGCEIPGSLKLEVGKYPFGDLYGALPVEWHGRSAAFPQRTTFEMLTGRLASGSNVVLSNGRLEYWTPNRGFVTGLLAVLSQNEFVGDKPRKYDSIEFQIEGLESIVGITPIDKVSFPAEKDAEPIYAARINEEGNLHWSQDGVEMRFFYGVSIHDFDPYKFGMDFSPVLRITLAEPITAREWWFEWVLPMRKLVSLLTKASRSVRYVILSEKAQENDFRYYPDQLFGWDIAQEPVNSAIDDTRSVSSIVNVSKDHVDLLRMLLDWKKGMKEHQPLLEIYGGMVLVEGQHPRSSFLMLMQAIEGSYGFEHRNEYDARQEEYSKELRHVMDAVGSSSVLAREDRKFIKENLNKHPRQGLRDALVDLLDSLPQDCGISTELNDLELIRRARSENEKMPLEQSLTMIRNKLSHGDQSFSTEELEECVKIFSRIVRSEVLRLLEVPEEGREKALER